MKRWLIHLTIFSYLGCLGWGLFSHGTQTAHTSNPAMYYVVWDMFCGWNAYSTRHHIIAEGASGKYYDVTSGPWGEFHPYGYEDRANYDVFGLFSAKMGQSTLRHTAHEPITRLFFVEESWAKKYNIPESYWSAKYDEPKDVHRYCYVRQVHSGDGEKMQINPAWVTQQTQNMILSNPQLMRDSRLNRPFIAVESYRPKKPTSFGTDNVLYRTANGN